MSTNVRDMSLGQFQHHRKVVNLPTVEPTDIFSAMSDAVYTVQCFLRSGGFTWKESQLVLTIAGMLGNGEDTLVLSDDEIAAVACCSSRTVQRWRADYKAKATGILDKEIRRFCPLKIKEQDHIQDKRITPPAMYQLVIAPLVNRSVAAARAMPEYEINRTAALEKAADMHYEDMPLGQYASRGRGRGKSMKPNATAHLDRAVRNMEKTLIALEDMNDHARESLLDARGEEMRRQVLELQEKAAELLKLLPEPVENTEDNHTYDKMSRNFGAQSDVRVKEKNTCTTETWETFCSFLTKEKANGTTIRLVTDVKDRASPLMTPAEVRACRDEIRGAIREITQDVQLWETYLAEADELARTKKFPSHRSAKERAILLSVIGGNV